MSDTFDRTELLIGKEALAILTSSKVAVFGLGGVGSYAAEALARAGIGAFFLVDNDSVNKTNINRQVLAMHSTIGMPKVHAMRSRIRDINPGAVVEVYDGSFGRDAPESLLEAGLSYIVDAIDTVSAKIELVLRAKAHGTPIISAMGAGNKLDPTRFEVADIFSTTVCPLARVMRRELKKLGVERLKVVYSRELPVRNNTGSCRHEVMCPKKACQCDNFRAVPGSISFVPSVVGLIAASVVVRDLIAAQGLQTAANNS